MMTVWRILQWMLQKLGLEGVHLHRIELSVCPAYSTRDSQLKKVVFRWLRDLTFISLRGTLLLAVCECAWVCVCVCAWVSVSVRAWVCGSVCECTWVCLDSSYTSVTRTVYALWVKSKTRTENWRRIVEKIEGTNLLSWTRTQTLSLNH
jgi:hypothetical protein